MRAFMLRHILFPLGFCAVVPGIHGSRQARADDVTDSFSAGREYFVLRSGNAKLILQSDKPGHVRYALINGTKLLPRQDGTIRVPAKLLSGRLDIKVISR